MLEFDRVFVYKKELLLLGVLRKCHTPQKFLLNGTLDLTVVSCLKKVLKHSKFLANPVSVIP